MDVFENYSGGSYFRREGSTLLIYFDLLYTHVYDTHCNFSLQTYQAQHFVCFMIFSLHYLPKIFPLFTCTYNIFCVFLFVFIYTIVQEVTLFHISVKNIAFHLCFFYET